MCEFGVLKVGVEIINIHPYIKCWYTMSSLSSSWLWLLRKYVKNLSTRLYTSVSMYLHRVGYRYIYNVDRKDIKAIQLSPKHNGRRKFKQKKQIFVFLLTGPQWNIWKICITPHLVTHEYLKVTLWNNGGGIVLFPSKTCNVKCHWDLSGIHLKGRTKLWYCEWLMRFSAKAIQPV